MKSFLKLCALAVVFACGLIASPAAYAKHSHTEENAELKIGIGGTDRDIIRNYLSEDYRPAHCPPGLAKKHNGCLPPGIAKKYQLGRPIPDTVEFQSLPANIVVQLHPVPGYRYVKVDQDVLLISEATKKVVDAVTLLSAVQ